MDGSKGRGEGGSTRSWKAHRQRQRQPRGPPERAHPAPPTRTPDTRWGEMPTERARPREHLMVRKSECVCLRGREREGERERVKSETEGRWRGVVPWPAPRTQTPYDNKCFERELNRFFSVEKKYGHEHPMVPSDLKGRWIADQMFKSISKTFSEVLRRFVVAHTLARAASHAVSTTAALRSAESSSAKSSFPWY